MTSQQPLEYLYSTDFGNSEVSSSQIAPNHQTFSNRHYQFSTQLPKPISHASQNVGYEKDRELFKPIPRARNPTKYGMTDGILASQGYPQRKYDKNQLFSRQKRVEIVSSKQPMIPSLRAMKPLSTGLSMSGSTSNLVYDRNSSHVDTEIHSERRRRSISNLEIIQEVRDQAQSL